MNQGFWEGLLGWAGHAVLLVGAGIASGVVQIPGLAAWIPSVLGLLLHGASDVAAKKQV